MSKDGGNFTKSLVESNEIFTEAIRLLQDQIKKVTLRLEGLEKDLQSARAKLKSKDIEILRLSEIIKTYETEQRNLPIDSDKNTLDLLLPQIKDLTETIKAFKSTASSKAEISKKDEKDHYEYEEVEVEDEEFNSLVEELESKKLEIQSIQQEKEDLFEEAQLLKSKIVHLEKNLESLSESKVSVLLQELKVKYDTLLDTNTALEQKITELEEQLSATSETSPVDEEHVTSLKNEVSKYVKENIQLQEKLDNTTTLEKQVAQQHIELENYSLKIAELEEENRSLEINFEQIQSNLMKLQETNQSLEQRIESFNKDNFDLKNENSTLLKQLNEKEEEIINIKLKSNQLEEELKETIELENDPFKLVDASGENVPETQDELLLKISEMEMEEANWQDEKKLLLETVESLKQKMDSQISTGISNETVQNLQNTVKSLKSEILELNHDIDDADAELKELELENSVLRERISELEARESTPIIQPSISSDTIDQVKERNTELTIELKETKDELDESLARLQSQEQRISHLEDLIEQEHELKEKFEFLYNNLKNRLDQKEEKRQSDNLNAQKQLEQVIKSLNLSEELTQLTTDDDDLEHEPMDVVEKSASASDDLGRALENTSLYLSLIDKFLKPHVQITQLLKQGDWEINSLADIVRLDKKSLMTILQELSDKDILQYDENRVWLTQKFDENKV